MGNVVLTCCTSRASPTQGSLEDGILQPIEGAGVVRETGALGNADVHLAEKDVAVVEAAGAKLRVQAQSEETDDGAVGETGAPSSADAHPSDADMPGAGTGAVGEAAQPLLETTQEAAMNLEPPKEPAPSSFGGGIITPINEEEDSGMLGIGSFLDIWSNSYQAWCDGVIQDVEESIMTVVYRVPDNTVLNMKNLDINSNEIRAPHDDGPWLNAIVEVFSHSSNLWLPARIQHIAHGEALIAYFYPGQAEGSDPITKSLPFGHQDLRFPVTYEEGANVEVFSNSQGQWLPGVIDKIVDGCFEIHFYYPGMNPTEEPAMVKELPSGSGEVRLPLNWQKGHLTGATVNADVDLSAYAVGNPIEVFSQSRQIWIQGTIKNVMQDGRLTVTFRYPDLPEDAELYDKDLPIGHPELRLPAPDAPRSFISKKLR